MTLSLPPATMMPAPVAGYVMRVAVARGSPLLRTTLLTMRVPPCGAKSCESSVLGTMPPKLCCQSEFIIVKLPPALVPE